MSPTLEAPINFRSNEIVTQGAFPDALCAAVPLQKKYYEKSINKEVRKRSFEATY